MARSKSDALVIFGVTGDLAHKMIFPALYAMVKRGTLKSSGDRRCLSEVGNGALAQSGDGQY